MLANMLQANISTVKNNLSQYLDKVAGGEEVVISDRNTPVAILIPFTPTQVRGNWSGRVAQLTKMGHLKSPPANSQTLEQIQPLDLAGGTPLSKWLLQEREGGR
jgi:prevent-host-death family protein